MVGQNILFFMSVLGCLLHHDEDKDLDQSVHMLDQKPLLLPSEQDLQILLQLCKLYLKPHEMPDHSIQFTTKC